MTDPRPANGGASWARRAARWGTAGMAVAAVTQLWRRPGTPAPPPLTPEQFDAAEPARGRAAEAPWRIPLRGWIDILWRTAREIRDGRLPNAAASIAFYGLVALFPAVTAFVSLYGIFTDVDDVRRHFVQLADFLPRDAITVIREQLLRVTEQRNSTLGAALAVSTLVAVWSANAGTKALVDGINRAYGESEKRPWLRRTVFCYFLTLAGLLALSLATVTMLNAPALFHAAGLRHSSLWWTPLRTFGIYILSAAVFTLLYRHAPSRAPARWRWVAAGGAAAALLWILGSLAFSRYLDAFIHFGATYGSLGAILGLMLWMWFSALVVLAGAELNAEIEHQTARDTTAGRPRPLGERGAVVADQVGKASGSRPGGTSGSGSLAAVGRSLLRLLRW